MAVGLLALAVHIPNLPMGKSPQEDAGVFLYAARTIIDGGVPYRDVWDHKPPLLYYVDALGLLLGGPSLIGVWALQALAHVVAAIISVRLLARAFGTWPALLGTAAWLLAAPRAFLIEGAFANFPQAFVAPLQFTALGLFLAEEREPQHSWRSYAIGATAGVSALVTPAGLGLWMAIALHVGGSRVRPAGFRPLVRRAAALALGAAGPVVLVATALALAGALGDAWDQAIAYNLNYAGAATLEGRRDSLIYGLRLLGSSGSLFLAAVGLLAALRWRSTLPHAMDARRLVDIALLAVPLELFFGSSTGRLHEYYWLAALPTIGLLSAFALYAFAQRVAPALAHRARVPAARLVVVMALVAIAALAVRPALLGARIVASREDGINAAAAAYVAERTGPGEEILVWGSRAAVLVLADRRSPTRFVYQYAPLSTEGYHSEANVDELVRTIRDRRPALILDASRDSPATPPLEHRGIAGHDTQDPLFVIRPSLLKVAEVVEELYERADPVPGIGWPVWRPRAR